jgi:hypothetical protein
MEETTPEQDVALEVDATPRQLNHVMIKLNAGSNIIMGQLHSEDNYQVNLYYPICISLYIDQAGELQAESSKFFPFSENDIVAIERSAIVAISRPKLNIIAHYQFFLDKHRDDGDDSEDKVLGVVKKANKLLEPSPMDAEPPTQAIH